MTGVGEGNKKWGYFCHTTSLKVFSLIFSPFWREKFLWAQVKNVWIPHKSFLSSPHNQTTYKFIFFPIFFPKFSILPISPPNKYTFKVPKVAQVYECLKREFLVLYECAWESMEGKLFIVINCASSLLGLMMFCGLFGLSLGL